MKPLDDSIVAVLQTVLRLEVRLMENCHNNEHLWQRKGYKKVRKYLDKIVAEARCRKRVLIDRIYLFDAVPDTSGGLTDTYDTIAAMIGYVLDTHVALNAAYQDAIGVCRQYEDSVTEDLMNDAQWCVQKIIGKAEKKLRQIDEVGGESVYLALMLD